MKQKNSASGFWRKSFSVQFSNSCVCNCVHHMHTFNSTICLNWSQPSSVSCIPRSGWPSSPAGSRQPPKKTIQSLCRYERKKWFDCKNIISCILILHDPFHHLLHAAKVAMSKKLAPSSAGQKRSKRTKPWDHAWLHNWILPLVLLGVVWCPEMGFLHSQQSRRRRSKRPGASL